MRGLASQTELEIKNYNIESFAEWKKSNNQKYLNINAKNHYEFGLLRGQFLKKEIKATSRILNSFIKAFNLSIGSFLSYARKYTIPHSYKDEIKGLSDGTGLTEDRILLQKCWIDSLESAFLEKFWIYIPENVRREELRYDEIVGLLDFAISGEELPVISIDRTYVDLTKVAGEFSATRLYDIDTGKTKLAARPGDLPLEEQAEKAEKVLPRVMTFVVTPEQEELIEQAVERASDGTPGRDRKARGLANLARHFLEESSCGEGITEGP